MEFISQRCIYLFESILRLPDFEMDTAIKPIHAPIHLQPTSKLEKIKSARGIYKETGQLLRVSQPTDWVSSMIVGEREQTPLQSRQEWYAPGSLPDSQQGNATVKVHHLTLEESLYKLHGIRYLLTIIDVMEAFQNTRT